MHKGFDHFVHYDCYKNVFWSTCPLCFRQIQNRAVNRKTLHHLLLEYFQQKKFHKNLIEKNYTELVRVVVRGNVWLQTARLSFMDRLPEVIAQPVWGFYNQKAHDYFSPIEICDLAKFSIVNRCVPLLKAILAHGIDIRKIEKGALMDAASSHYHSLEMLEVLVGAGANVLSMEIKDIHLLAVRGSIIQLKALRSYGHHLDVFVDSPDVWLELKKTGIHRYLRSFVLDPTDL